MTVTGDATAFLRSSSIMNFNMTVQIYDSNLVTLISEDKSIIANSVYGGHYIRKSVTAGQYLVIRVESNGTFEANSYDFGVVRHTRNPEDFFESNNHPNGATNLGGFPSAGVLDTYYTHLDSNFDIDWYKIDFTSDHANCYPKLAFIGQNDIKATLFTKASNGNMTKLTDLTKDGTWDTYPVFL